MQIRTIYEDGWSIFLTDPELGDGLPHNWIYTRDESKISVTLFSNLHGFNGSVFYVGLVKHGKAIGDIYMGMDKLKETLSQTNIAIPETVYEKWNDFSSRYGEFKGAIELPPPNTGIPLEKKIIDTFCRFTPEEMDKLLKIKERYERGEL
jgi:hypothetical protein